MPAAPPAKPAARYGKYRPIRKLGAGGMGVVYLAEDTELGRQVALKTLPKTADTPPNLLARFRSEARAAAKLHHPGIVQVFDTGETDDALYIALEFVDGKDVDRLLKTRDRLPPKRAADLVRQIAEALEHLHERGVVHRDVKPSNVMVRRDGTAVLTDLGLARAAEEDADGGITRAGYTVGTVDYMSPEQARSSRTADVRSDLYSLGCTWFHMLTGRIPFPGDSLTAKLAAHAKQPVPDPRQLHDDIPASFTAVLHRALAKNPDDRHQTPAEFLEDLRAAMRNRGSVSEDLLRDLAAEHDEPEGSAEDLLASDPATPAVRGRSGTAGEDSGERAAGALAREERAAEARRRAEAADLADSDPDAPAARRGRRGAGRKAAETRQIRRPGEVPAAAASAAKAPARRGRRSPGKGRPEAAAPADGTQPKVRKAGGRGVDPVLVRNLGVAGLVAALVVGAGYVIFRFADSLGGGAPVVVRTDPDPDDEDAGESRGAGDAAGEDVTAPTVVRDAAPRPAATNANPAAAPAWVAELAEAPGRGRTVEVTDPDGLAPALRALPNTGGTVTLAGPGPFALPPVALPEGADVTLAAADGQRPVVALAPPAAGAPPAAWLTVRGGSLTLAGVHFVLPDRNRAGDAPVPAAVDAAAATLAVRGGSVTAAGDRPATFLVAAPGPPAGRRPAAPGRVLIDGVVLRGAALTAVRLPAGPADLFARNALFATGRGPVVRFGGEGQAAAHAAGPFRFTAARRAVQDGRTVTLVNCGGVFADAAFALAPGARDEVRVTVAGSALGAAPGAGTARLAANPGAAPVAWTVADSTLAGLALPDDAGLPAANSDGWPGGPIENFAAADPDRFRPDGLAKTAADWAVPGGRTLARAAAVAALPPPAGPWEQRFPDGERIEVDAKDAAAAIAKRHPDGTTVVIRGGGRVNVDPLTVAGRSLRLLGEPGERDGDADPAVLVPPTGLGGTALLTAAGGRLELDNLALEARTDRTGAGPLVLADGPESLVVVRRAKLEAGDDAPALAARAGGSVQVERTLLVGPAALLDAGDGRVRGVNVMLASPGAAVTLAGGTVLLANGTLSVGGPIFSGEGTVLTRRCLFAPAPPRSPAKTALTADPAAPAVWGDGDAFAPTVRPLAGANPGELRDANTGPAAVVLDRPNLPVWNRLVPADLLPAPGSPAARGGLGAGGEVGPVAGRGGTAPEPGGGGRPNRPRVGPNF